MSDKFWTLDDGLRLVRGIQATAKKYGYYIALAGGVLNKGFSEKDIDLVFLPYQHLKSEDGKEVKPDAEGIVGWLTTIWGEPRDIGANYNEQIEYTYKGQRVTIGGQYKKELEELARSVPNEIQIHWNPNAKPEQKQTGTYKFKLKFNRSTGDRIDVFII